MRNLPRLSLLTVALALSGCNASLKAPQPWTPPLLDQHLANDCQLIGEVPQSNDFDVLLVWVQTNLLPKYADCAIRHRATVAAWPKPAK